MKVPENLNTTDLIKLKKTIQDIPAGSIVTIEGTPIVMDQDWNHLHEIGLNCLLTYMVELLQDMCDVQQISLFDDSSVFTKNSSEYYLSKFNIPPYHTRESELYQRAQTAFNYLLSQKLVFNPAPTTHGTQPIPIHLNSPTQPLLGKFSQNHTRYSAALNDAVYQQSTQELLPGRTYAINIHPREGGYMKQQPQMRDIAKAISQKGESIDQINIYFTSSGHIGVVESNKLYVN